MTEYRNPTTPMPPLGADPAVGYGATSEPSMSEKASDAMEQGKQAVGDVAGTAGDKAREVKDETMRQARDLLGEARGHVTQQASEQHRNLVANLRSLSEELGSMHADQPGVASELVGQARSRVDDVANWLEQREPGDLVEELRGFARRRPGVFLLGAAVAGVAVGRLARGAVAAHSDDSSSSSSTPAVSGSPHPGYPTGEYAETGFIGAGATPTSPHDPSAGSLDPGYGAPTYPATGGGSGGPQ